MSSDISISVQNISKSFEIYAKPVHRLWQMLFAGRRCFYREFKALQNIDFDVRRGECVGIIGRNGAGKSTLLQIIAGTLRSSSGSCTLSGRVAALLELGSGFNPEFSGKDNVFLNAAVLGFSREQTEARYQEILDFADIGDFIDQPVKTYSSGMLVRLAFAVQVMLDPDVLIVDEALAVGDIFFQQKCFARLKKLTSSGTTILFVSHDIALVKSLCSRAVYLKEGKLAAFGPAAEVCDMYYNDTTLPAADVSFCGTNCENNTGMPPLFRIDSEMEKRITERSGSYAVKVTAFDFYDMQGRRISDCFVGDRIKLVISFTAQRDIPVGAQIGVLCRNERGYDVFATNLVNFNLFLPALEAGSKGVVSWEFDMPVFGTFLFSMGIKPDKLSSEFYDRPFNLAVLKTVKRDPEDMTMALLAIPPENFEVFIKK